jgi:hypothetical protein
MKRLFLTLVLATVPAFASAATRVSSDSNCPSSDAISQRLLGLVPAGGPASASVRVRREGATIHVELAVPGEPIQTRIAAAAGDCEERAEMAALIIASWLDVMPAGTIAAPGIPPREPRPAPVPSAEPDPVDESHEPRLTLGKRTLVGAGIFGLADKQGSSTGAVLEAAMPNLLDPFGWLAEVALSLPRELTVGQGTARYWRPTIVLAATGEIRFGNWVVRPRAGAALGILLVSGSGYEQNGSATTVTWGGGAGVALARVWRGNELWIRFDGLAWPQGRAVRSRQVPSGKDIEVPLPELEGRLVAGFSWGAR